MGRFFVAYGKGKKDMPTGDTQAADGQALDGATDDAQAGGAGNANDEGAGQDQATFDAEYVKKLRSEAASWRTKHQQAQKKLDELDGANLTEVQKAQKALDAANAQIAELQSRTRKADIMVAATKANAKYPDAVAALVAADADDFTAEMKRLRKDYPDMFKPVAGGSADGGAGAQSNTGMSMNDMIRQSAGRR